MSGGSFYSICGRPKGYRGARMSHVRWKPNSKKRHSGSLRTAFQPMIWRWRAGRTRTLDPLLWWYESGQVLIAQRIKASPPDEQADLALTRSHRRRLSSTVWRPLDVGSSYPGIAGPGLSPLASAKRYASCFLDLKTS